MLRCLLVSNQGVVFVNTIIKWVVVLLSFGALMGCSGKAVDAPEIKVKKSSEEQSEGVMEKRVEMPLVRSVHNLSAGDLGYVGREIVGLKNGDGEPIQVSPSPDAADVLLVNANEDNPEIIGQLNALLRSGRRVIVDSDGAKESQGGVSAFLKNVLGGNSVINADAAIVNYHDEHSYSIVPLYNNNSPDNANTASNVLGLQGEVAE